jgi:choline dehydrogenase-like flavoprotein
MRLRGPLLKHWLRESPIGARLGGLILQGEDAPQPANRVDLDPELRDIHGLPAARITYAPHAFELEARRVYAPRLLAILEGAGAQFGAIAPPYGGDFAPGSRHVMGTLRMGRDPRASVVDAFGRFHDLENLYACDGSLFPTSSGYNPTLTIQALALRVGGALVDRRRPLSVVQAAEAAALAR